VKVLLRTLLTLITTIMCLAACLSTGWAQDIVDANSADLDDFRTSFKNPASLSFLPNQLIFGTKAYEVGINSSFYDVSHGYIGYYSPYWRKRVGVFGEFLRTGIFNMTDIGVSYSERLNKTFAIGGRLDLVNQGFDESQFQGVDPGDPILSSGLSKNYLSLTAGLIAVPIPELSFGAVIKNFNKPNVAMEEDNPYQLPVRYDFGLQYRVGRLHPSANISIEDSNFRYRFRIGVLVWDDIWTRFDYEGENLGFEGQMRFYRGFHFNYRYQYPLNELNTFSEGSHTLFLVYDFTRILAKPQLPLIQYLPDPVVLDRTEGEIPLEGDFYILASTSLLEIWEKTITRKVDPEVPLEFIRRNYDKIFQELRYDVSIGDTGKIISYPDTLEGLVGTYTHDYISSIDSISGYLLEVDSTETRIYAREEDVFRAENIKDVITNKSKIPADKITLQKLGTRPYEQEISDTDLSLLNSTESFTVLSEEIVSFDILSLNKDRYDGNWSLLIRDLDQIIVKSFDGTGNVPRRLEWDWAVKDSDFIKPGWYSFVFRWEDKQGRLKESPMGKIHVKKNKKDILIELTKKKFTDKKAKRLEIHLDQ